MSAALNGASRRSPALVIFGPRALPVAKRSSVSEVEVSLSTVIALKLPATPFDRSAWSTGAAIGAFREALDDVLLDLAHLVVRDGEGARKFVEVRVEGAVSKASARRIALSIANSPLVKTAIAGEDANWGRIVMAVGKAGEPADRDRLAISFGDIRVAVKGERDPAYSEAATSAYMKNEAIVITVDIGLGKGSDRVWTCDLTKEYVAINGDYRS